MDFNSLKRRDLQILSKKNNIPANITNAAMADALASLDFVEGVEEVFAQSEAGGAVSPERSPNVPKTSTRTSTRQRVVRIEESEGSKVATRTRCSTRKQTPATTRTTRRAAPLEESVQRKIEENRQAEFEANLEQSQVLAENESMIDGCESTEVSEVVSEVVNETKEVSSIEGDLKVDFNLLSRKELQNLCKRNKIPANTTNAAMIDALEALDTVEGVEDLVKESDPLGAKSPETCRMTSSRVRQTRTSQRTTQRKPAQSGSALGKMSVQQKDDFVVQSFESKMDLSITDDVLSKEVKKDQDSNLETLPEKLEVLDCVSENDSGIRDELKSTPEEVSDDLDSSVVVEAEKELQDVVGNNCDEVEKEGFESCEETVQENASENEVDEQDVKEIEDNESLTSDTVYSDQANVDEGDELEEISDESDTSIVAEANEEIQDVVVENESDGGKTDSIENALEKGVDAFEQKESSNLSEILSFDEPKDEGDGLEEDFSDFISDFSDLENVEIDGLGLDDMSTAYPIIVEDMSDVESVLETLSNGATQDHGPTLRSVSVRFSDEAQEVNILEVNAKDEVDELLSSASDAAVHICPTTQVEKHARKVKGTPLHQKSMRKLKKILKEKLQATSLLENKIEKLTLEEREVPLVANNADVELTVTEGVPHFIEEEHEEIEEESDGLSIIAVSGVETTKADGDHVNGSSVNLAVNPIVNVATECEIYLEKQPTELVPFKEVGLTESEASQRTPSWSHRVRSFSNNPLLTPSKSSSKIAMSAGLDMINKENIDNSACKTGPGKTDMAVFGSGKLISSMSMGKLKKEFKVLQQHSEKKRPALQSRSENLCPLASP